MALVLHPVQAELFDQVTVDVDGNTTTFNVYLIHGEYGWEASLTTKTDGRGSPDQALGDLVAGLKQFLAKAEDGITLGDPRRPEPVRVAGREE